MFRPVSTYRSAVVGEAGLDPLHAVHVGSLPRHGRQHSGPRGDARVLIGGTQKGEAVPLDGQHGRGGAGRPVDHHADLRARRIGAEGGRHHGQAAEHRRRDPAARPRRRRPDLDAVMPGRRTGNGLVTQPGARGALDAVTDRPGPCPAGDQGQPLLTGPTEDGPESQGHTGADTDQGDEHAHHRRGGPQGHDPYHQTQRHRGDLAAAPAGDDPPLLQGWEPVPDAVHAPTLRHRRPTGLGRRRPSRARTCPVAWSGLPPNGSRVRRAPVHQPGMPPTDGAAA